MPYAPALSSMDPSARRTRTLFNLAVAVGFVAVVAALDVASRLWLGRSYLRAYLDLGGYIAGAATLASAVLWDFDSDPGQISAEPMDYLRSQLWASGGFMMALSNALRRSSPPPRAVALWPLDGLLSVLWSLALFAGFLLWSVLVVPVQYFIFLVAGAPARTALVRSGSMELEMSASDPEQKGLSGKLDLGFDKKPYTATQALTSALLFAAGRLL